MKMYFPFAPRMYQFRTGSGLVGSLPNEGIQPSKEADIIFWDGISPQSVQNIIQSLTRALPWNQLCYTDIRLKAREAEYKGLMWALPRIQLWCTDIASKHVQHNTKSSCGHFCGTNFVTPISSQSVYNAIQKLNTGTLREQLCCTDVASAHVQKQ